ncbi:MAG: polysaccharide deacetylase family protein [Bacilli bacterium]|nr:polysaccharide deacetylase family protein [Bacilli bacterium]MDD3896073.1 polysaccharide deacetylase family protein [Bacilli bacterium]MDD4407899.1 polysaccharide deacetylase family protein [Bacilli bacterium]
MTRKNKNIIIFILLILIIFSIIVTNLFIHFSKMQKLYDDKVIKKSNITYNYPYFDDDKDIYITNYLSTVDNNKIDNIKYIVNYLGDHIVVLFKLYKNDIIVDYKSIIFKDRLVTNIDSIITNQDEFMKVLKIYRDSNNLKISDAFLENGTKSYLFKDTELDMFLSNYDDKNSITLFRINYKEIEKYLNFPYHIDSKYQIMNDTIITTQKITPIDKNKKLVAFTFDDGPSVYTLEIAEVLEEFNANATFFMVGYNIKIRNSVVLDLYNKGFELGNHTIDHSRLTKFSCDKVKVKIEENNDLVINIINEKMKLFRPTYGALNIDIKPCIKYPIILWSVDSRDWESRNVESITYEVISNLQDGDIVLFHDLHKPTLDALKIILPLLYDDNFQVVSVSELFEAKDIPLEDSKVYRKARINDNDINN